MSMIKNLTSSSLLLSCLFVAAAPVWAGDEQEKEQVLSVMQGVANAWNHGNIPAATDFEPSLTVVDDTPPYLFQGPNAITDWIEAYRQEQPKDEKESKTSLHFLKPLTV